MKIAIQNYLAVLLAGAVLPLLFAYAKNKLTKLLASKVAKEIEEALLKHNKPEDKALILAFVKWAEVKLPNNGQGKERYALVAERLSAMFPFLAGQKQKISELIEAAIVAMDEELKKLNPA